ncbi:hypothetical protein C8A01DRAFT_51470 [Parachaetomium inaequale]|uniref:Uncharacterized protein n=1 Tax=Parachaetomium inaequale TaxID=2588326 RepID=A0AAN6P476_9PEZI|nr:hypothetical protein C8A01DRAFT_51470 [Parachaetomium inaequale]
MAAMMTMFQQFQQFLQTQAETQKQTNQLLKAQTQAVMASASHRKIQAIDKLTKQEDFPVWRDDILRVLKRAGLEEYVTTTVTEPEDEVGKTQWNNNRADIEEYIRAMVPGQKGDPKKAFDMVAQNFEKGSSDSNVKMAQELANIRRANFGKLEAFQLRINYLCDRLNDTKFKMDDEAYIWFCLKGIEKEYSSLYDRLVANVENGKLTWGELVMELQRLAVGENVQPAIVRYQ